MTQPRNSATILQIKNDDRRKRGPEIPDTHAEPDPRGTRPCSSAPRHWVTRCAHGDLAGFVPRLPPQTSLPGCYEPRTDMYSLVLFWSELGGRLCDCVSSSCSRGTCLRGTCGKGGQLSRCVRHPRHATWVPACLPCDGYKRHMCMYTVKVYEATRSIPVTGTEITDIYCIKPKGDGRKCPGCGGSVA